MSLIEQLEEALAEKIEERKASQKSLDYLGNAVSQAETRLSRARAPHSKATQESALAEKKKQLTDAEERHDMIVAEIVRLKEELQNAKSIAAQKMLSDELTKGNLYQIKESSPKPLTHKRSSSKSSSLSSLTVSEDEGLPKPTVPPTKKVRKCYDLEPGSAAPSPAAPTSNEKGTDDSGVALKALKPSEEVTIAKDKPGEQPDLRELKPSSNANASAAKDGLQTASAPTDAMGSPAATQDTDTVKTDPAARPDPEDVSKDKLVNEQAHPPTEGNGQPAPVNGKTKEVDVDMEQKEKEGENAPGKEKSKAKGSGKKQKSSFEELPVETQKELWKDGYKAIQNILKPLPFDPRAKPAYITAQLAHAIRQCQSFLPESATTSREVAIQVLYSNRGNTRCLYHDQKQKEAKNPVYDGNTYNENYVIAGVPRKRTMARRRTDEVDTEEGFLNCGCSLESALWELLWWKTWTVTCEVEGENITESLGPTLPNPRLRLFYIQAMKREGIVLDDFYTKALDVKEPAKVTQHEIDVHTRRIFDNIASLNALHDLSDEDLKNGYGFRLVYNNPKTKKVKMLSPDSK